MDVSYLGQWKTPFWVGDENKGTLTRIGFEAKTRIDRHEFGVSWQDKIPGGGVVVSNEIEVTIDVEAILDADLESTGAIEYYQSGQPGLTSKLTDHNPNARFADNRPDAEGAKMPCTHLDYVLITELPAGVRRLRGLPRHRRQVAASADLPGVRKSRLLRRLAQPSRHGAREGERAPDHPLARARRSVVVVLYRRTDDEHPRGARRDSDPAVTAGRVGAASRVDGLPAGVADRGARQAVERAALPEGTIWKEPCSALRAVGSTSACARNAGSSAAGTAWMKTAVTSGEVDPLGSDVCSTRSCPGGTSWLCRSSR